MNASRDMIEPGRELTLQPEPAPTSVLEIIDRAARDPDVNIDKLERLLAMQQTIVRAQAEADFNAALVRCQVDMRPIAADAENPQTRSRYASYSALDKALRPIYTKHGLALSFDEADCPKPDYVRVICYVSHSSGFTRSYHRDMPADGKGAKGGDVMTKTHAAGAAQSYGMRYLVRAIFNVAVGEDDRDGNDLPTLDEKQVADLLALLTETGADVAQFKRWAKVTELGQILAKNFEYVCTEVRATARHRAEAQARREARK